MNFTNYRPSIATLTAPVLLLLLTGAALSQQPARRPRPPVEPANLVYETQIDGVKVPIHESYIRSSDGLYIPAVVTKPAGDGPFPAAILVHGAPGGRGMSALKRELQTRGMVAERFLKEGYTVIVSDYRRGQIRGKEGPKEFSYAADIVSVIRYAKQLSYVDPAKVCVYSGSLGSESTVLALGEESVAAAVINAPAGYTYLKISRAAPGTQRSPSDELTNDRFDKEVATANLSKINSPTLFVVGTADNFLGAVKKTQSLLTGLGKDSSIDIYPDEKHGFYWGPRKTDGAYVPTPAFAKALDKAVAFFQAKAK